MGKISLINLYRKFSFVLPKTKIYTNDFKIKKAATWQISPESVHYHIIDRSIKEKYLTPYFIADGVWDKKTGVFTECSFFKLLENLYNNGGIYNKAGVFEYLNELRNKNAPFVYNGMVLTSEKSISFYIDHCIDLFESMRSFGFDPNKGSGSIGVAITRQGTFVKSFDGRHRLAVAKLLGLKKITIRVTNIHAGFVGGGGNRDIDMFLKRYIQLNKKQVSNKQSFLQVGVVIFQGSILKIRIVLCLLKVLFNTTDNLRRHFSSILLQNPSVKDDNP